MNQTKWQENTLLETKEKPTPITASHTNTPQNQVEKMLRTKYQYSIEKPQNKYSTP
jgi:hypothetical protein